MIMQIVDQKDYEETDQPEQGQSSYELIYLYLEYSLREAITSNRLANFAENGIISGCSHLYNAFAGFNCRSLVQLVLAFGYIFIYRHRLTCDNRLTHTQVIALQDHGISR